MWKDNLFRILSQSKMQRSKSKLSTVWNRNQSKPITATYTQSNFSQQNVLAIPSQANYGHVQSNNNNSEVDKHLKAFISKTKDFEQPKFGDLKLLKENKRKQWEKATNEQNIQLVNYQNQCSQDMQNSADLDSQQNVFNRSKSYENNKSQEILKIGQLQNKTCRPTKNNQIVHFDKQKSSILQKRRSKSASPSSRSEKFFKINASSYNDGQFEQRPFIDEKLREKPWFLQQKRSNQKSTQNPNMRKQQSYPKQLDIISEESTPQVESSMELSQNSDSDAISSQQQNLESNETDAQGFEKQYKLYEQIFIMLLSIVVLLVSYLCWINKVLATDEDDFSK